jgi:hypothetical protein
VRLALTAFEAFMGFLATAPVGFGVLFGVSFAW